MIEALDWIAGELQALREQEPELDRLFHDRPDAVVIGGWLRDKLTGHRPKDIDVVLTAPEPYLIPLVLTDTNKFGGKKVTLASGFVVDYWNAVTGCTVLDQDYPSRWLQALVAGVPLTAMQCAYHPPSDLLWVDHLNDIESKLIRRTARSRSVGLSREMRDSLPIKIAAMEANGWTHAEQP